MVQKAVDFLEDLQADHPDIAADVSELASLYQRKLWHQITVKIEQCYSNALFNRGDIPIRLFKSFIQEFGHKINLLKLAQFGVHASKYLPDSAASVEFLNSLIVKLEEMKLPRAAEPVLFLKTQVAQYRLESGALAEAKTMVEGCKDSLEGLSDVDPSVSAAVYYVLSLYHKAAGNYADFYRSALVYLSYVSSDALPDDFKLRLAVDVGLAALLGEHVYSFGQLLQHPIVGALDASPGYSWLHELLRCFNDGNMTQYDELCAKHAAQLNAQPALVANERRLREKITIMSLLEMISALPAEERRIPLSSISERTKLNIDGVEFLLMKALSLHLIEGTLDQVDSIVQVTWVQPRVLTKPQIQGLKDRLDTWISKVASIAHTMENETLGMVEA